MSEIVENVGTVDQAVDAREKDIFDWKPAPDHVLRAIVDLVNTTSIQFGITLTVNGFQVSGLMVSGRAYFDGLSDEMASGFTGSDEDRAAIKNYFARFGDTYNEIAEDENRVLPVLIHLKDAKFFHNSGQPMPGNRGVWWRGRLSCVSGFCMGTLGASQESP